MTFPAPEIITPKSGELFDQQVKLAWTKTHPFLFYYFPGFSNIFVERGTEGTYISKSGRIEVADPNTPRITWWDRDGDEVPEPYLLLEHTSTNLVPNVNGRPANMSAGGTTPPTVQLETRQTPCGSECWAITFPDPVTAWYEGSRATSQPDTFPITAGLLYARTLWVAGDTTGIRIYHTGTRSLGGDLAPTGRQIEVGGMEWREFTGVGTAPDTTPDGARDHLAIIASTTSAAGKTIRIAGHQVEQAPVPSSMILGSPAPVTRAADVLTFPWPHAPQAMTGYLRFVERGAVVATSASAALFRLGTAPQGRIVVSRERNDGRYRFSHLRNDEAGVASVLPTSPVPAIGDQVELLWRLYADGSVQIEQSINGGAPVVAARSAEVGLPTEWSGQILRLSGNPLGGNEAPAAWRDAIVLRGSHWTMEQVREVISDLDWYRRRESTIYR